MPCYSIQAPAHIHLGSVVVCYEAGEINSIDLVESAGPKVAPRNDFEAGLVAQFEAYFADPGFRFALPLQAQGTEFQRRVWRALQAIPAGRVRSYGELAAQLGSSARAVGNACRRNPLPIVVPCHRVVAKAGIGGFGGALAGRLIEQKRRLLQHEGVVF
jgi:methylated-DNA-[protein]-cysteine S-methyltransferase